MLNTIKRGKLFTRRALVLAGFKGSLLAALIARLYYLQIVKSTQYKTFSDSNRIKDFLIPPLRGKILDRNGKLFAGNENYYRILFDPDSSTDHNEIADKLTKIIDLPDSERQLILQRLNEHRSRRAVMLYEHLSWNDVAKIEVNLPDLPGIFIDVGQIRDFPMGEITSHLIGYMGPVSETEIKKNNLLNHPDFKIGRSGIEKVMENTLRGKAGVKRMEVNAHGLIMRELSRENGAPGENLYLTLDKQLQQYASKRLEGLSGSAVVIDIKNGNVLSYVSSPGFDPNQFSYGIKTKYWKELTSNLDRPLINKPISSQYPPGSTFKLVVCMAALKEGVDPKEKIYCPGYYYLGRRKFHCWKEGGHGKMDMKQAIMHSCNTYFYTISKKIGVQSISNMARKFGFVKQMILY